jgi:hypothetical protein
MRTAVRYGPGFILFFFLGGNKFDRRGVDDRLLYLYDIPNHRFAKSVSGDW